MEQTKEKNSLVNIIKNFLSKHKIEFGEATLTDGTQIFWEGDVLEVGSEVTVEVDGEMNPAPEGSHETVDGLTVVLDASGIVVEIMEPGEEETEEELSKEEEKEETEATEEELSIEEAEAFRAVLDSLNEKFEIIEKLEKVIESQNETIEGQKETIKEQKEKFETLAERVKKLEAEPQEEPKKEKFIREDSERMNSGLPVNPKYHDILK